MIVQIEPDQRAKSEAGQRQDRIPQNRRGSTGFLRYHGKLPEAGEVHSHESQKGAEIQQLTCVLIGAADVVEHYRASERESPR